jgi:hypothetical protein
MKLVGEAMLEAIEMVVKSIKEQGRWPPPDGAMVIYVYMPYKPERQRGMLLGAPTKNFSEVLSRLCDTCDPDSIKQLEDQIGKMPSDAVPVLFMVHDDGGDMIVDGLGAISRKLPHAPPGWGLAGKIKT